MYDSRLEKLPQPDVRCSDHAHEPFSDDWNHEDYKPDDDHLQRLRTGGQSEDQTGDSGHSEDECQDSQDHLGYTVQKDPSPLDQRQRGDDREQQDLSDYLQHNHP